ncbi:hypothetical protein MTO96_046016 [Rhipicephalus appendiculatus]
MGRAAAPARRTPTREDLDGVTVKVAPSERFRVRTFTICLRHRERNNNSANLSFHGVAHAVRIDVLPHRARATAVRRDAVRDRRSLVAEPTRIPD